MAALIDKKRDAGAIIELRIHTLRFDDESETCCGLVVSQFEIVG